MSVFINWVLSLPACRSWYARAYESWSEYKNGKMKVLAGEKRPHEDEKTQYKLYNGEEI